MRHFTGLDGKQSMAGVRRRMWKAVAERVRTSPAEFRGFLSLERAGSTSLADQLCRWQEADFAGMDDAWRRLAVGLPAPRPRWRRGYLERPRGHSKTTDTAVQLAWILLAATRPLNGLVAAADFEQAQLVHRALERLATANPELLGDLRFVEGMIRHPRNGSRIRMISSDVRGSWGELPDFIVCDELCHWKSADLWHSLLSSAAKRPESVLVVLSNAGVGQGWQWDIREAARGDADWYFSTLDGPQAPWVTEESLAEQRRLLPPAVFARLWLNQWQHSDGEFVSLSEATACRDISLAPRTRGEPGIEYVAAIDYAEKRDLTVGCVCHRAGQAVIVDRMDVVRPSPLRATPVQWVSDWIPSMAAAFPGIQFIVDPHQLVSVIQGLEHRYPIQRFEFRGGQANCEIAIALRQLILERQLRWYPGCGVVPGEESAIPPDDLEHELASLVVREQPGGRFRFDHRNDGRHHDDRAFALGVACQSLIGRPQYDVAFWDAIPPEQGGLL